MEKKFHEWNQRRERILEVLKASKRLNSMGGSIEERADAISHGLLDMVDALGEMKSISDALGSSSTLLPEQVDDLLFESNRIIEHLLYHIKDMGIYSDQIEYVLSEK